MSRAACARAKREEKDGRGNGNASASTSASETDSTRTVRDTVRGSKQQQPKRVGGTIRG
jgi:hypothetical protein